MLICKWYLFHPHPHKSLHVYYTTQCVMHDSFHPCLLTHLKHTLTQNPFNTPLLFASQLQPRMPTPAGANISMSNAHPVSTNMASAAPLGVFSTTNNMATPGLSQQPLIAQQPVPRYTGPTPKTNEKPKSSSAFADLENLSKSMMQQQQQQQSTPAKPVSVR